LYHQCMVKTSFVILSLAAFFASAGTSETSFACNLKALSGEQRKQHAQLSRNLFSAVTERRELTDGYAFRISLAEVSLVNLAEWVQLERKCCPFFRFRIEVTEQDGRAWLSLEGAPGVKKFIEAEFRLKI
jgi:hypothetical protein